MGFEPTDAFTSPVFKTGAFDHSAISPCVKVRSTQTQELFYHRGIVLSIKNKRRKDGFFRKNMLTFAARSGIINKLIRFRRCKKQNIRVWRSLVSRLNGVQEASSSNLDTRTILWRQNRCLPRKSPILSGFFATQTAIFLCAETQM